MRKAPRDARAGPQPIIVGTITARSLQLQDMLNPRFLYLSRDAYRTDC